MTSPSLKGLSVAGFPFYYGWVVAAVGTLGIIASSPGQTYVISIFLEPLLNEFEITRTTFASLYMVATLGGSLLLPRIGMGIDRFGCRAAMTAISLALALSLVLASQMNSLYFLGMILLLLRLFGQGSMTLVSGTMINQWWMNRRGRIMGLVGLLSAVLGTGCFPPLIHYLIANWGWRNSFLWEAAFLAFVVAPLAWLFARHRPEEHDLMPDGAPPRPVAERAVEVEGMSKKEAQRTAAYWVAVTGVFLTALLVTGLHFHAVGLFADKGLSAAVAAASYLPIAATTSVVTFVAGWLVERISILRLLAISLLGLSVALLAATHLAVAVPVIAYAIILGTTGGMFTTVSGVIWSQLFGRRELGSITGAATTFMVAGSAFGPLPLSWARDRFGSFDEMLTALAVLPVILALVTLYLDKPKMPTPSQ